MTQVELPCFSLCATEYREVEPADQQAQMHVCYQQGIQTTCTEYRGNPILSAHWLKSTYSGEITSTGVKFDWYLVEVYLSQPWQVLVVMHVLGLDTVATPGSWTKKCFTMCTYKANCPVISVTWLALVYQNFDNECYRGPAYIDPRNSKKGRTHWSKGSVTDSRSDSDDSLTHPWFPCTLLWAGRRGIVSIDLTVPGSRTCEFTLNYRHFEYSEAVDGRHADGTNLSRKLRRTSGLL